MRQMGYRQQQQGQASATQPLGQPRPVPPESTLEELIERVASVSNRLEGLRNQLFAKLEKLRGETPMKEPDPRAGPAVPTPCMASGMLGALEQRIRDAQTTLDQLDALMQDLNQRI